jgi:hypothetical protein
MELPPFGSGGSAILSVTDKGRRRFGDKSSCALAEGKRVNSARERRGPGELLSEAWPRGRATLASHALAPKENRLRMGLEMNVAILEFQGRQVVA